MSEPARRTGHPAGVTVRHSEALLPTCARTGKRGAIAEIWESLSILESRLGHSRRTFAYPNGTWDQRTAAIVARVYRGAVATGGGDLQSQDRLYALRRIKAEPTYDPESLLKQM